MADLLDLEGLIDALETNDVDESQVSVTKRYGRLRRGPLTVDLHPTQAPDLRVVEDRLRSAPAWREHLGEVDHELLSLRSLDGDDLEDQKYQDPPRPSRFEASVFDYTNNRTLVFHGSLRQPEKAKVAEFGSQPRPSPEEFDAAVAIVREDPRIASEIDRGSIVVYRPMPPLLPVEGEEGRTRRVVTIGLLSPDRKRRHRIEAVDMHDRRVLGSDELDGVAHLLAHGERECAAPPGDGNCPSSGSEGQVTMTVRVGRTVLWQMRIRRPAASSGLNGSGIELRYVDYRGKRVLYRANVPVLNVRYVDPPAGCGPAYRDWLDEESCFEAHGSDVGTGFRLCPTPARTIFETGSDSGNFRGVAVYIDGAEVVLVSELAAGWYRYVSEWRFHVDGSIRPRFGFTAVDNSCTCAAHRHHAYWRFDFDINGSPNDRIDERINLPIFPAIWFPLRYETRRSRVPILGQRWRVVDQTTNTGYELIPGPNDAVAGTDFAVGDVWALRYRPGEIDDGQGFTTSVIDSRIQIDKFDNDEPLIGRDVVLWYGTRFLHDEHHPSGEIVGPVLRPVSLS